MTVSQDLVGDVHAYPPGTPITLRVNSANPDEAMVWSPATAGAPAAPAAQPIIAQPDDTIARLEQLGRLRDSGAISADEFEQQKARILGK